jgi:hypothetical protein
VKLIRPVSRAVESLSEDTVSSQQRRTSVDLVADCMSEFGATSNRYDVLTRDRLPAAMYSMELQHREHPLNMRTRVILANSQVSRWLIVGFILTALCIAPLARIFGAGLLSPVTYPLLCFASAILAYHRFTTTRSVDSALRRFLVPQAFAIFLEWTFSPGLNPWWALAPTAIALFGVGYIVDEVNTHYILWITANPWLTQEAVEYRREVWTLRFDRSAISKLADAFQAEIESLEARGDVRRAGFLRRRRMELLELRQYSFGFIAIPYALLLLFVGVPSLVLLVGTLAVSLVVAFRRPRAGLKLNKTLAALCVHAFVSWFSWDPRQDWVHSPGMFRDGLNSPFSRLTQTLCCLLLVQITFVPPVHLWGSGELLTPGWLWTLFFSFFLNLFLPVLLLLSALIATGARPLWAYLSTVEGGSLEI